MTNLEWANEILIREAKTNLYGNITFSMQNGILTNVKIERSEKPPIDKNLK